MNSAQTLLTETAVSRLRYQPMGLADLTDAIINRLYGNRIRPYAQFCMDWNYNPELRKSILEEDISGDCPPDVLAAVASVVHGLCEKDGLSHLLPAYLLEAKAAEELLLHGEPIDHPWSRDVRDAAPDVCWQHNVFYDTGLLYSTCNPLTSIRQRL